MAFVAGNQTRLITGPFALSAFTTDVAPKSNRVAIPRTALTDEAFVYIPGLRSSELSVTTMVDSDTTAGGYWDSMVTLFTSSTSSPVSVAPAGFSLGSSVWMGDALNVTAAPSSNVTGGVDMPLTFGLTGAALYGQSLTTHAALTTTTTGTAVDGTAASTNGGIGHLHVTAVSGTTPTCDVTIEHSVNGSTSWATLATFTQVTTATASQRVTVAAGTSVRRYLRAVVTIAGTGPSYTVAVAFARS